MKFTQRLLHPQDDAKTVGRVYEELKSLKTSYPNFAYWYRCAVVSGLKDGKRSIEIVERGNDIAGILITKHDVVEKKLCTLYVNEKYRHGGIGKQLFCRSFEILDTDKPVFTVSEDKIFEFKRLFDYFGFSRAAAYHHYYTHNKTEFAYNGLLTEEQQQWQRTVHI